MIYANDVILLINNNDDLALFKGKKILAPQFGFV